VTEHGATTPAASAAGGIVFLVGAGPGDPGLITVRGVQCLRQADVVVYDYLAAPELLGYAAAGAERIYVGKKGGDHTLSQEGINALLVKLGQAGKRVCRLKGGDPYIFGRGGEEAEALVAAGIPFEVVPGVTSAVAAPAYAGIPLTHRRLTATVAFVTGHEDPEKTASSIDWASLARGIGTLVFFMGVKNLPHITANLRAHGRPATTPVALVQWGTTTRQRTVTGTLDDIVARAAEAGITAPAITVVGEVVGLRPVLGWFEQRPLLGRTVVVTRAREQASDLTTRLTALGAECLEYPTIQVLPPERWEPLDTAIRGLERYRWVIFTSVNGVTFFFERLYSLGRDARALGGLRTAVIGPATAARLRHYGVASDILPASFRAESIVEAFRDQELRGVAVLLPRAREARLVLPEELRRMGAGVDEVEAYRTVSAGEHPELLKRLEAGTVDMVTFTSSSTVRNFCALLPAERVVPLLRGVRLAAIGPITADTARELGLTVDVTAEIYTIDGLCDAIVRHTAAVPFAKRR
jgi:uroporphyrinogen III methyltransferase/synthase